MSQLNLFAGTDTIAQQHCVNDQTGQLIRQSQPPTEVDIDAIVAATGVDIGDMWIIDTGAEISMAKDAGAGNADANVIANSMVIDGSNPGPKSATTHEVQVNHDCGTIKFRHRAVGPSKCNVVSTNDVGAAGISVPLSAVDPQCQTMLLFCAADPSGASTVAAVRAGGLWAVPRTDLPGASTRASCARRTGTATIAAVTAQQTATLPTTGFAPAGVQLPPGAIVAVATTSDSGTTVLPTGAVVAASRSTGVPVTAFARAGVQIQLPPGAIVAVATASDTTVLPSGAVVLAGATGPGITLAPDGVQRPAAAAVTHCGGRLRPRRLPP